MADFSEDKYLDVLQSIEVALAQVYDVHPTMMDVDALEAVNGLARVYQAEANGRAAPRLSLRPQAQQAFDAVKATCEFCMRRAPAPNQKLKVVGSEITPKTADEISQCLKRIRRSIELWNKEGGPRGYYNFVRPFLH